MLTTGLDDRTFDDLVGEAINLLPTLAPEWTNHNPSDPGITLVELLAYFTEILVYRLGRIPPETELQFLKLLCGPDWEGLALEHKLQFLKSLMGSGWEGWRAITQTHPPDLGRQIECAFLQANPDRLRCAVDNVIQDLMRNGCAVTTQDFEYFAQQFANEYISMRSGGFQRIRTLCVPSVNLENDQPWKSTSDDRAHVSVVVAPGSHIDDEDAADLREKVQKELSQRCMLTTRLHVVAPVYLCVAIAVKLASKPGQSKDQLWHALREMLEQRFGSEPEQGPSGEGRPFGKSLHMSELVEVIDETLGVDYVEEVTVLQMSNGMQKLTSDESALGFQIGIHSKLGRDALLGGAVALGPDRLVRNEAGSLVSIALRPWELLRIDVVEKDNIEIIDTPKAGSL